MPESESMTNFTSKELIAIDAYWMSCVIPIFYANDTVCGTGLLFTINKHLYIITAAHVAGEVKRSIENVGILASKGSSLFSFKNCVVFSPKVSRDQDKYDVAIICLDENEYLCQNLKENYTFLSTSSIANYRQGFNSFFITGFPIGEPVGRLFKFQTKEYKGTFSINVEPNPDHDIFLSYSDELISNNCVAKAAPNLHGVSGCPIWGVIQKKSETQGIWYPENQIKVVGFEVSYTPNIWIRGIKWYAVAYTFGYIDVSAKKIIYEALNNELK